MVIYSASNTLSNGQKILIMLIAGVFLLPWTGWAFSVLWGWFIAPVFGLPLISWMQAIGIGLVVDAAKYKYEEDEDEDSDETFFKKILSQFFTPLVYLGMGWIVMILNGAI